MNELVEASIVEDDKDILEYSPYERMQVAVDAITKAGVVDNVDPDELVELAIDTKIPTHHMQKLAGMISYIKCRTIEKQSRVASFEKSFPSRSYNDGGDITRKAKETKARRIENTKLYKKVITLLHTSLYITYAIERMRVLDEALDKCFDDSVADRDKGVYMKLFLEETRKPENAKFEISLDMKSNKVIESKLDSIAKKLEGQSASDILKAISHDS